jgi:hypothetical protein
MTPSRTWAVARSSGLSPPFGASQVRHVAVELLEADSYHRDANEWGNK